MNKKARSKITLNPKAPFKWVFMDIVPSTAPKSLTSDTTFYNYILIVDAYYNIPKLCGMDKITTEEVMDKLDMFEFRFRKIDEFGWWDLERNFSRCRYAVYLDRVQRRMPKIAEFV